MDIYLRQSWVDPRLQLRKFGMNETVTLQGQDVIDNIWKPDIFFRNLKSGNFHSMTVSNKLIKLSPDGRILFSMRLTLRLSCHMSFRNYPLDAQRCWVILGSYAMTTDQVQIQWNKDMPITIEKEIQVPEFQVVLQDPGAFNRDIDTVESQESELIWADLYLDFSKFGLSRKLGKTLFIYQMQQSIDFSIGISVRHPMVEKQDQDDPDQSEEEDISTDLVAQADAISALELALRLCRTERCRYTDRRDCQAG
ncbi:Glycine receptor subunit alpha-3 [Araneus ventricosus]|uniref:Glycine receptor subunit alpha-3 n=1 Tax=Araneus ventricosus TaxID=182803 RepID=A0A4Y2WVD0_ARAVE|nr:Glycine receptor subunit alpha-3 [Araneus ventricosus]GBO41189.1 Glycine receptor subunit alpha-3 [Araneus ventricosus]